MVSHPGLHSVFASRFHPPERNTCSFEATYLLYIAMLILDDFKISLNYPTLSMTVPFPRGRPRSVVSKANRPRTSLNLKNNPRNRKNPRNNNTITKSNSHTSFQVLAIKSKKSWLPRLVQALSTRWSLPTTRMGILSTLAKAQ